MEVDCTHESSEMIRTKPIPISACEDSMLRVVVLDSTHKQGSSKYFLFNSVVTWWDYNTNTKYKK